jgi:hypothetical protein
VRCTHFPVHLHYSASTKIKTIIWAYQVGWPNYRFVRIQPAVKSSNPQTTSSRGSKLPSSRFVRDILTVVFRRIYAKRCLLLRKLFSDSTYSNASYSLVLILQTTDAVYPGHSLGHRNLPKFIESARVIHVTRSGDYSILKQKPPKEEKRNVYKWVLIALDTLTGAGITSCQHIYRTVDSGKQVL